MVGNPGRGCNWRTKSAWVALDGPQAHDKIAPGGQRGQAEAESIGNCEGNSPLVSLILPVRSQRVRSCAAQTNARAPAKWSAFFPDWPSFGVSCTLIFAAAARDPVAWRRSSALAATQPPPPCAIKGRRGHVHSHYHDIMHGMGKFLSPTPRKMVWANGGLG